LRHFYTFEDGRLIKVQPVTLKVENGCGKGGVQIVEEIVVMYCHSFTFPLVETSNAKVGALLDVGVLKFFIVGMNGVVVERPSGMKVFPNSCDRMRGPRAAVAFVRPGVSFLEMSILEGCLPLCGPVSLKEGMPFDRVLCRDSALAVFWVSSGIDGFTIKPCIYAFNENNHEFEMGVEGVDVGAETADKDFAPSSEFRAGASKKVLLCVGFMACRAIVGSSGPLGLLFLGGEYLVYEFEQKFVDVTRIVYCGTKKGEVNSFESEWVPVMDVAAFVEKGFLGSGFTNVMFIVACDCGGMDIEVDFCGGE
jgi:hypothetical protein